MISINICKVLQGEFCTQQWQITQTREGWSGNLRGGVGEEALGKIRLSL